MTNRTSVSTMLFFALSFFLCHGADEISSQSLNRGTPEKDLVEAKKVFTPDMSQRIILDGHLIKIETGRFDDTGAIESYYEDNMKNRVLHGLVIIPFKNIYSAFLYRDNLRDGFFVYYKEKPEYRVIAKGYYHGGRPFNGVFTYGLFEKKAVFSVLATYQDGKITKITDFNNNVILENRYDSKGNLTDGYEIIELPPDKYPYNMKMRKYIDGKCVSEISASELYTKEQRESSGETLRRLVEE